MTDFLLNDQGDRLAFDHCVGRGPTVLFLPGFHSDMQGRKALALHDWAREHEYDFLRFDYRGHGQSDGNINDYVLSDWLADARLMLERQAGDRSLLVGSSMGAWLALQLAEQHPARTEGVITIAAATDFTDRILSTAATPEQLESLAERGCFLQESEYDDRPYSVTLRLIEDGQRLRMLHRTIEIRCPVVLLHGSSDSDVPWVNSLKTLNALASRQAELVLVKDGDHRLSSPPDLRRLTSQLERLLGF